MRRFLEESLTLTNQGDKANADAVFQVSIAANAALYEKIRSDEVMCKAMEDLMKDVIVQREENAKQEERKNLAASLIKLGKLTIEEIAAATGLTMESLLAIENNVKAAK